MRYWVLFSIASSAALIFVFLPTCIWVKFFWRRKVVDQFKTYAIRTEEGIQRFPMETTNLYKNLFSNNHEYIVKGLKNSRRFKIDSRSRGESGEWRTTKINLMNPNTGAIDLQVYTMVLQPFEVHSSDHHIMKVYASIEFQLDRTRLYRCFQYGDIGVILVSRFENIIRSQISSRENQEITNDIEEIKKLCLSEMRRRENSDQEALKNWKETSGAGASDREYFRTTPSNALGIIVLDVSVQVEQVDSMPIGGEDISGSVMTIPTAHLDNVRDMFLQVKRKSKDENKNYLIPSVIDQEDPYTSANESLLRMLEMHTRENIATKVANSGKMIVVSSKDLGMARTSIFRSGIKLDGIDPEYFEKRKEDDD